ncbi:zinc finger 665-like protein [Chlorella sorokiniana]|uniref:Zinc finger 665-like protein n=1 Tax=Chlorella sorokiniana TaxID=3076 RepID=A0A2P6TD25_CHLSO|nr:zinc finger 665-like protein [Chlorella sorokiniana]|eukprot:PRW20533.1 zinc finger 665-like protein [Chlorella sorokiniana]
MFRTDSQGRAVLAGVQVADELLAVEQWGRWRQPQQAPQLLMYDIVLERSTVGVPHSALPLLAAALLLLALVAGAVPWWSDAAVPNLLNWLNGNGAAAGAAGLSSRVPARSRGRQAAVRAAVR